MAQGKKKYTADIKGDFLHIPGRRKKVRPNTKYYAVPHNVRTTTSISAAGTFTIIGISLILLQLLTSFNGIFFDGIGVRFKESTYSSASFYTYIFLSTYFQQARELGFFITLIPTYWLVAGLVTGFIYGNKTSGIMADAINLLERLLIYVFFITAIILGSNNYSVLALSGIIILLGVQIIVPAAILGSIGIKVGVMINNVLD